MPLSRRQLLATAAASSALGLAQSAALADSHEHGDRDDDGPRGGRVFTSSNDAAGNALLVLAPSASGALAITARLPTGGLGSGAGLGSQGAVTLSRDGRHLFVVNAQSNSVSTFRMGQDGPKLLSVTDSGGLHPISVSEHDGRVVVLNDGGAGNVAAFQLHGGRLQPVTGSVQPLSAAGGTAPAQVSFSDDGDAVIVTEKGTNLLLSYRVGEHGRLGAPRTTRSPGQTPFGFAFSRRNVLVVSEAWGGAAGASTVSSYRFGDLAPIRPVVISASVANGQGAACWVAITPDGRWAFISNTGSSTISRYRIQRDGSLALVEAVAGSTGAGSTPADNVVSLDGRSLHVRNGRTATIASFSIRADGSLGEARLLGGLPPNAVGLAAS